MFKPGLKTKTQQIYRQEFINPNGTHSFIIDNGFTSTIINPDGTHSTAVNNGNTSIIVTPNEKKRKVEKMDDRPVKNNLSKDSPEGNSLELPKNNCSDSPEVNSLGITKNNCSDSSKIHNTDSLKIKDPPARKIKKNRKKRN